MLTRWGLFTDFVDRCVERGIMNLDIVTQLTHEFPKTKRNHIESVLTLLEDDNTIPFIARYRKEMTGSMDEVMIKDLSDRYQSIESLMNRKEEVKRLIDQQGALTPELILDIDTATTLRTLDDLYRPYRPKRRTKATIAKEQGLEPLALDILKFPIDTSPESLAQAYIDAEKGVETIDAALQGAHEILAETFSDNPSIRSWIRSETFKNGVLAATLKDKDADEKGVFEMYYSFSQAVKTVAPHRVLALNRAENLGIVGVNIEIEPNTIFVYLGKTLVGNHHQSPMMPYVVAAYEDSYKRFIKPAIERELRKELTEKAHEQAVNIFGENLRNLLLQPPLKGMTVLGFDPAYRTGCKLAIVDQTGKVLDIDVIYPHPPASRQKQEEAKGHFKTLIEKFNVNLVAIGNGTASRESEVFVAEILRSVSKDVFYVIVNEAGASVYSASDVARKEFPHLEVEQRSAVSIARRVQDPLAELVKIDPKSVGVGQYQHDVVQKELETRLDFVVETAVNQVGVNVNTASPELLTRVAGLNKTLAQNVVAYRNEKGRYNTKNELKKVPRLGAKSFEQAAGFIRIMESDNVLDKTGIHPESYDTVKRFLKEMNLKFSDIGTDETLTVLSAVHINEYASKLGVGEETLRDIVDALKQPGRDYRDTLNTPILRQDVLTMEDLKQGMELQGTVRNVVDFGAFVDIGVKQDGLVHISKLSTNFVKHPTDVVSVGDIVKVWVIDVDLKKERIQLSMVASS